jgi:hypothetical protein
MGSAAGAALVSRIAVKLRSHELFHPSTMIDKLDKGDNQGTGPKYLQFLVHSQLNPPPESSAADMSCSAVPSSPEAGADSLQDR